MPKLMKPPPDWDEDDVQTGDGNYYDGPRPTPGPYKGVVKIMSASKIAAGKKDAGAISFYVLCEITEGKFKGAGVSKWLQLTTQGRPWLHQFLHSLTDGSEAQMRGIRKAFKEVGYAVDPPDEKKRLPVVRIGKKTNPIGLPCNFMVRERTIKGGERDGEKVTEIGRFLVPFKDDDDEGGSDDESSVDDILNETAGDDDSSSASEDDDITDLDATEDDSSSDDDSTTTADDTDPDDPWSV